MSDFNPYAPPEVARFDEPQAPDPDEGRGVWRDGEILVMARIARLPMRCLRCNEPATNRLRRTLYWHHPALYFIILAHVLIYFLVAVIVRKSVKVNLPLCDEHRARRRGAILASWVLGLAGLATCFVPAVAETESPFAFILGGLAVVLFSLIFGSLRSRVVVPKRIDDTHAWIKKVSPFYLAELPELPSPYERPAHPGGGDPRYL